MWLFCKIYFLSSLCCISVFVNPAGKDKRPSRLDVTALLVGLITAGVLVIIVGLLLWYFCQHRCKGGNLSHHRWAFLISGTTDAGSEMDLRISELICNLISHTPCVCVCECLCVYACVCACMLCACVCLPPSSVRVRNRRSNASLIMRRLDEVSLQPGLLPPPPLEAGEPPGLPSYEQAIAKSGPHDAPPPPYPG